MNDALYNRLTTDHHKSHAKRHPKIWVMFTDRVEGHNFTDLELTSAWCWFYYGAIDTMNHYGNLNTRSR